MTITWVVVADSSRARFFSLVSRIEPMQEMEDLTHAEGRMHDQEETSDRRGGIAGSQGQGGHSFEAPTDIKRHDAEVFARQIATKLEQGRTNQSYENLVLVAPPAFLGALRSALNPHLETLVANSLDKNLVTESERVIREHIL